MYDAGKYEEVLPISKIFCIIETFSYTAWAKISTSQRFPSLCQKKIRSKWNEWYSNHFHELYLKFNFQRISIIWLFGRTCRERCRNILYVLSHEILLRWSLLPMISREDALRSANQILAPLTLHNSYESPTFRKKNL